MATFRVLTELLSGWYHTHNYQIHTSQSFKIIIISSSYKDKILQNTHKKITFLLIIFFFNYYVFFFFSFSILLYYRNYTLMRNNSVSDGFPKFIDMFLQTICVESFRNNVQFQTKYTC
jgi:hypothetical protein